MLKLIHVIRLSHDVPGQVLDLLVSQTVLWEELSVSRVGQRAGPRLSYAADVARAGYVTVEL